MLEVGISQDIPAPLTIRRIFSRFINSIPNTIIDYGNRVEVNYLGMCGLTPQGESIRKGNSDGGVTLQPCVDKNRDKRIVKIRHTENPIHAAVVEMDSQKNYKIVLYTNM